MKVYDYMCKTTPTPVPWRLLIPKAATKEYCVLWLQGWTTAMDMHRPGVERLANQTGVTCAMLDFAGHGTHPTSLEYTTRKQQLDDVVAIFDELTKLGYANIITVGGSFGGYLTALLTHKRPVHTAVLRAPANYRDEEFETPYTILCETDILKPMLHRRASDALLDHNSAIRAIEQFSGFTYVLEHELDEVVPARIPKHYFAAAKKGNYLIIPATPHSPKNLPNPQPHFTYIEHTLAAIIKAAQLQGKLSH